MHAVESIRHLVLTRISCLLTVGREEQGIVTQGDHIGQHNILVGGSRQKALVRYRYRDIDSEPVPYGNGCMKSVQEIDG